MGAMRRRAGHASTIHAASIALPAALSAANKHRLAMGVLVTRHPAWHRPAPSSAPGKATATPIAVA